MEKAGKNRSDYKKVNRGLVMKMVATGQCSTRADLTRSTGLSKMAISNIVTELIQRDLLVETRGTRVEELGRTPVRLGLSSKAPKVVGLLIDRDRCEAVLCSLDLKVLRRETVTMENMTQVQLVRLIYQLLDTVLFGREDVAAIGVASIGPVSAQTGMILKPFFFYGIHDLEIVRIITERYHLPVFFDHDNQSAILAESLFGNGRGFHDVLFVGIGEGVGCGNRGCVETYLRTPELLQKMRYFTGKYFTYEGFCALAEQDERVDNVLTDAVMRLATGIVSIINILNSELILLGNDSVFWPDRYLALLEEEVGRRRFVDWDDRILVKRAYFMRDAALMGAACNAVSPVFEGELLFEG